MLDRTLQQSVFCEVSLLARMGRHDQADPPGGNPQPPVSPTATDSSKRGRGNLSLVWFFFFNKNILSDAFSQLFKPPAWFKSHFFCNSENHILIFVSFFRRCKSSEIWVCNFSANREKNICKCCSRGLCFKYMI